MMSTTFKLDQGRRITYLYHDFLGLNKTIRPIYDPLEQFVNFVRNNGHFWDTLTLIRSKPIDQFELLNFHDGEYIRRLDRIQRIYDIPRDDDDVADAVVDDVMEDLVSRVEYQRSFDPDYIHGSYCVGNELIEKRASRTRKRENYLERFGLENCGGGFSLDSMDISMEVEIDGQSYDMDPFNETVKIGKIDDTNFFNLAKTICGGSIAAAASLNEGESDIGINWQGGQSSVQMDQSVDKCYLNDTVLSIIELMKKHLRVLYISIGEDSSIVQEAFQDSERVATVSFHVDENNFFDEDPRPCNWNFNFPLKKGIQDGNFLKFAFHPLMKDLLKNFEPTVIVFQPHVSNGGDQDKGLINITHVGYCHILRVLLAENVPLLLLGNGTLDPCRTSSRCFLWMTILALGIVRPKKTGLLINDLRRFETIFQSVIGEDQFQSMDYEHFGDWNDLNLPSELRSTSIHLIKFLKNHQKAFKVQPRPLMIPTSKLLPRYQAPVLHFSSESESELSESDQEKFNSYSSDSDSDDPGWPIIYMNKNN